MPAFEATVRHLRRRLAEPLPGAALQLGMAPSFREELLRTRPPDASCREAGVLALFFPREAVPHLLLTVRRDDLPHHPGQVSFPGGRREADETLLETALRETHEEVGLPPDDIEILGPLTPLYVPPSNFCVHPFVGALPYVPDLTPQDAEVAALLSAPLPLLLDPTTRRREPWTLRGQQVEVPFLAVEDYKVWGATAMMLAELLSLFPPEARNGQEA